MSFRDDRLDLQKQAHVDKTAGTLLEKMEKLRNSADGPSRRRWVWELVQNAVDVARPDAPLQIEVSAESAPDGSVGALVFAHNGRPFSFKNLVYLAEQVSTKERHAVGDKAPETVGRFGTGFLTTHLLSEQVTVAGACADEKNGAVRFELPLDRSGVTRDEMAASVERAMEVLDGLDEAERLTPEALAQTWTRFGYCLGSEGLEAAKAGLEDLHALAPYTLAFDDRIDRIWAKPADFNPHEHGFAYRVAKREQISDGIELVTVVREQILVSSPPHERALDFVVARGGRVAIALPARVEEDGLHLQPVPDAVPRLHCAFPLVGTERFPFPAVVNSARFHPTEERDGVWLGTPRTDQQRENWSLMAEAKGLLERVVAHAATAGWRDLYALADFGSASARPWLDAAHYGAEVRTPLQRTLAAAPLVETAAGTRKALGSEKEPGVWIPRGESEEDRVALWELFGAFAPDKAPKRDHVEPWHRVRWDGLPSSTPEVIANTVASAATLEAWAGRLKVDEAGAADWLTRFVAFLADRKESALLNRAGKGVLPNQRGQFRLRKELFADDEIPTGLKDLADAFGYDVRAELLDARVYVPMGERDTRTSEDVAAEVRRQAEQRLREVPRSAETKDAFGQLLRWFHENVDAAKHLFGDLYASRHTLRSDEEVLEDMEKARQLDDLLAVLDAHGVSTDGLAAALTSGGAKTDADAAKERQAAVDYVADLVRTARVTTFEELAGFINAHPDKFQHHSQATLDGFLRFLAMTRRAKDAVRAALCAHPDYDCSGWTEDEDYPTIVHGVRRAGHGREIYLVVRPSDGGRVILYYDLEPVALEDRDGELWVQDEVRGVRQVTLGMVFRALREQLQVNQVPVA